MFCHSCNIRIIYRIAGLFGLTMAGKNDITGDNLISKVNTKSYDEGWDRIFNKKETSKKCKKCGFIQQKPNFVLCESCGTKV